MRYILRQKLLSWGDDYTIRDEAGRDAFFIDGKVFTIGQKLSFQDMSGQELAFIQQKLLSFAPTYHIFRDGRLAAIVKKELFTFFHCRFSVDVPGPDDLLADGDLFDHEYSFTRQGTVVAAVSKKWFSFADTYGVDISDSEDDVLILASAVVIDLACHGDRKQ